MSLDVVKVCRLLERGVEPVEPSQPPVDSRIASTDGTNVAFEMANVNGIETNLSKSKPTVH